MIAYICGTPGETEEQGQCNRMKKLAAELFSPCENRPCRKQSQFGPSTANPGRCPNLPRSLHPNSRKRAQSIHAHQNSTNPSIPSFPSTRPGCSRSVPAPPPPPPSPAFYENNGVTRYSEKCPMKTNNLKSGQSRKSAVFSAKTAVFGRRRSRSIHQRPVVGRSCDCPEHRVRQGMSKLPFSGTWRITTSTPEHFLPCRSYATVTLHSVVLAQPLAIMPADYTRGIYDDNNSRSDSIRS
jgi:hypothetical protein